MVEPEIIYNWFDIVLDKYQHAHIEKEEAEYIREFIQNRPDLYLALFKIWLSKIKDNDKKRHYYYFQHRILDITPPEIFFPQLLDLAKLETDDTISEFLFTTTVVIFVYNINIENPQLFLEQILDFVEKNPRFQKQWDLLKAQEIPEWKKEDFIRKQKRLRESKEQKKERIKILTSQLESIASGKDFHNLDYGARIWFKLFYDLKETDNPYERLVNATNEKIAESIEEGFEKILLSEEQYSLVDITRTHQEKKRYHGSYGEIGRASCRERV